MKLRRIFTIIIISIIINNNNENNNNNNNNKSNNRAIRTATATTAASATVAVTNSPAAPPPRAPPPLAPPPFPAARLSCSIIRELVKNGRNDGFGVEPIDMLSISGPESSPSQHESDSSSWKSASKSRSPRNAAVPLCVSSSSSSLALKRFSSANIFCLKLRCCSEIVWKMQWKEKKKKKRGKRLKLAQRNQLEITVVKRGQM